MTVNELNAAIRVSTALESGTKRESEPVAARSEFDAVAQSARRFPELAMRRRSVRRYGAQPIPRALLRELVGIATHAPSNFNRQPWHFVVFDSPAWIAALTGLLKRAVTRVERQDCSGDLYNVLNHVRTWLFPLETSAAIVLAFYKPHSETLDDMLSGLLESGNAAAYNPNLLSLGMAIQNLLLAAESAGLGACMHSGPLPFLRGTVNRLLHLPARLELAGLISLGWPDETPVMPPHRKLDRVVTFADAEVPAEWSQAWRDDRAK